jgi:hypothetical protein
VKPQWVIRACSREQTWASVEYSVGHPLAKTVLARSKRLRRLARSVPTPRFCGEMSSRRVGVDAERRAVDELEIGGWRLENRRARRRRSFERAEMVRCRGSRRSRRRRRSPAGERRSRPARAPGPAPAGSAARGWRAGAPRWARPSAPTCRGAAPAGGHVADLHGRSPKGHLADGPATHRWWAGRRPNRRHRGRRTATGWRAQRPKPRARWTQGSPARLILRCGRPCPRRPRRCAGQRRLGRRRSRRRGRGGHRA